MEICFLTLSARSFIRVVIMHLYLHNLQFSVLKTNGMIVMVGNLESGEKQIRYHHLAYNNLNQTHLMKNTLTGKDIFQKKRLK